MRDAIAEALSPDERVRLVDLEETVAFGKRAFLEVGEALAAIRDGRLYRETHASFEAYLAERWDMGRAYAYRLIGAAEVVADLSPIGDTPTPASEAQVRELAKAAPEDRDEVWQQAVARAGGEAPPARLVAEVVAERAGDTEDDRAKMLLAQFGPKAIADAHKKARAEKEAENRAARIERIGTIARGNRPLHFDTAFSVVLADPPWRYERDVSESRAVENHYPTMALEEIMALPVGEVVTEDAILFLWVPPGMHSYGVRVLEAWGFEERSSWVWVKDRIGMGYWGRLRHETILIGVRGAMPTPPVDARFDSVIDHRRGAHSEKPPEVAERIEKMYPTLPKLEMFCRSPRADWTAWGNQAEEVPA